MDVCLGLGLGETIVMLMQRLSHSGGSAESEIGSPRSGTFSWSCATRGCVPAASRNSMDACSPRSQSSDDSADESRVSSFNCASAVSEPPCNGSRSFDREVGSTGSSSPRSHSIRSLFGSGKRKGRKPVLLGKVPFGKRSEYLTLYVGTRTGQSEKFVISKRLLAHPLFQVLMKCSEDEFGEDYLVKRGIAIICDPALFLEVVRAVDDDMWSAENAHAEGFIHGDA